MSRSFLLTPVLLTVTLLDSTGLAGQAIPRTRVFEIAPCFAAGIGYHHAEPGALAFDGGFAVYWRTTFSGQDGAVFDTVQGRLLDASGRLGARLNPDAESSGDGYTGSPAIARESSGNFLFAWWTTDYYKGSVYTQRFLSSGDPETPECQKLNENADLDAKSPVAASDGGRTVVVWLEDDTVPQSTPKETRVKARVFATGGAEVTGERLVDVFPQVVTYLAVGVDAGGRFVILWWTGRYECSLVGQRFAPDGSPLGERFTLAEARDEITSVECILGLDMAMAADGSFAVAWKDQADDQYHVKLQRFRPQGTPESVPLDFQAADIQSNSFALAGDRYGNLALLRPQGIQMFNRQMVKQGPLLTIGPWDASVALGDRLLAVWTGPLKPGDPSSVLGRTWDVRRDADACAYRGNRFLFDTAGDGGEPDVVIPFGSGQGIPLLGDYNGDGRDDPCLYQGGRFVCDTAHDGFLAEKQSPKFGKPGDVPLLGDLDGDGRDDPCVRRGKTFLCDSDRNGKADRSITFGQLGDQALIGDVDGDGRGDPCVVRNGAFLCDSAHNGGGAETLLSLSAALSGLPKGIPALGDIDGDGREDPCVFTEGRLVCGLFAKGAKLPSAIVDRPFGEPGDTFLLGDLDAF